MIAKPSAIDFNSTMFAGPVAIAAAVVLLGVFFALVMLVAQLEILLELRRQRG
ncbi:hypothetical protein [Blastopirellula marina]|uniref:Uncharacterized protein n=1 Tax=Blastopirellula marina DSM 3645 TaxID=314230 RepID=A3ZUY0_9BACT|nr:hypothetical protein [Blastopirellula marina]EAQ79716.1 hypothetical protein DSM3645_24445 [Blastopirellula marina DSM 3645]